MLAGLALTGREGDPGSLWQQADRSRSAVPPSACHPFALSKRRGRLMSMVRNVVGGVDTPGRLIRTGRFEHGEGPNPGRPTDETPCTATDFSHPSERLISRTGVCVAFVRGPLDSTRLRRFDGEIRSDPIWVAFAPDLDR